MANTFKPKRSYTASNTPTLAAGELGINAADGKMWIGNAAGTANVLIASLAFSDHTGTLAATKGGTGITTYTLGDLLYCSASNTLSKLAGQTTSTRKFLRQTGTGTASAAPAWDTITQTDVGLSNVENTALSTWSGSSNITTVGTLGGLTVSGTVNLNALIYPSTDGTAGQVLSTNGLGTLSWASAAIPSGSTGDVQYNDGSGGLTSTSYFSYGSSAYDKLAIYSTTSTDNVVGVFASSGQTGNLLTFRDYLGTTIYSYFDATGNLALNAQNALKLYDADSSNFVAIKSPTTVASNVTWTLPNADGANGNLLYSNGSGTLGWSSGITYSGTGNLKIAPSASTGTQSPSLTVTGPAHTALTASTESNDLTINLARTVQFATGALTTQRGIRIQAPTYSFVGASTITHAATVQIDSAPSAGTNATITYASALRVIPGTSGLGIVVTPSSASATGDLIQAQNPVNNAVQFSVNYLGGVTISPRFPPGSGSSPPPSLTIKTLSADLKASTEYNDISIYPASTINFQTGNISLQRSINITPPTYSFTGASTITTAVGMQINSAPIASTNATITNAITFRALTGAAAAVGIVVQGAASQTGDLFQVQNSSGTNLFSFNNNGSLVLGPYGTSTGNTNELRFLELAANGTNYVGFKAPDLIANNAIWTLPSADGVSGAALTTNGSGTLSWSPAPSAASSLYLANNFGGL